ncbi:MAG: Fe-S cluster assembly sulfur transfer protein SufU [Brevinema sp.]
MLENLAKLYQELILEHSKNPKNIGVVNSPTAKKGLGLNPSCGDKLILSLDIQDGIIKDLKHESDGCSIFRASCSMMSQILIGKTKEVAEEISTLFIRLITFDEHNTFSPEELKLLGKLQVFENVSRYPARVKCAALFTRTLQDLLKNYDSIDGELVVSTENDF